MDTNALITLLGSKATFALFVVYFMNWLKKSSFAPWINYETDRMNHFVSIILTGVGTLGIHFAWNSSNQSLLITGLNFTTIAFGVWNWVQQYLVTKVTYSMLKDKINPPKPNGSTVFATMVAPGAGLGAASAQPVGSTKP